MVPLNCPMGFTPGSPGEAWMWPSGQEDAGVQGSQAPRLEADGAPRGSEATVLEEPGGTGLQQDKHVCPSLSSPPPAPQPSLRDRSLSGA